MNGRSRSGKSETGGFLNVFLDRLNAFWYCSPRGNGIVQAFSVKNRLFVVKPVNHLAHDD